MVRYIGKSTSGMTRPRNHGKPSRLKDDGHRANWIRSLKREGLTYSIAVLEEVPTMEALYEREMWWIAFGRACGWPLTNLTNGGDGMHGWVASPETRARISAAAKRRFSTAEARERLKEAFRDSWTPERRAQRGEHNKRRGQTPESRAKIAASMRAARARNPSWPTRKKAAT
jgi:hypothetical protein